MTPAGSFPLPICRQSRVIRAERGTRRWSNHRRDFYSDAAIGRHAVILIDPPPIALVRPVRHIAWRGFEPTAVKVDDISALACIVGQYFPGQWMVALADAQKAAERHHCIGDLTGVFIDHYGMNRP